MTTKKKKTDQIPVVITGYKGFDKNLQCRGFQFKEGETYTHDGPVRVCSSGFHFCENPFDVLDSYNWGEDNRFAMISVTGVIDRHKEDSKTASGSITIDAELKLPEFIKAAVDWIIDFCKPAKPLSVDVTDNGNLAQIGSSGYYAKIGSSGDYAQIGSSGNYAQIGSSGYYAQIDVTGESSVALSAGHDCKIKSAVNGAMALTRWVESDKRYRVTVAYVGENGIKADTWYILDKAGQFVEI